jgi:hypothetical protein
MTSFETASLSYRVTPKIMGAALSFDQRKDAEQIRFVLLAIVLGGISGLAYRTDYWPDFIIMVFAAYALYRVLHFSRLRRKVSEEWGKVSLLLREDGLEIAHSGARTLYFWPYVREIRIIRKIPELDYWPLWPCIWKIRAMLKLKERAKANSWVAVILNSAQGTVLPVPLAAFPGDAERQAFVALIEAKIRSASKDG